jgi:hypothetical protein
VEAQITTRIDAAVRDEIQRIADSRQWSFSHAVRMLIREGLTAVTEWDGDGFTVEVAEDEGRR